MTVYVVSSPVGPLSIELAPSGALRRLEFGASEPAPPEAPPSCAVAGQLGEYFAGSRTRFELDLAPDGTEFQRRVWDAMVAIPWGRTMTYGELARQLGDPGAVRAVGRAAGQNPIAIVVPCHRVIGATGKLVGFGGGLAIKRALLELEGAVHQQLSF